MLLGYRKLRSIATAAAIAVACGVALWYATPSDALWQNRDSQISDDTKQVVLVTGSSRGIGMEFAIQYAKDGWKVLASTRDGVLPASLVGIGDVEAVKLDLLSPADIAALAANLDRRSLSVDVLINNAAVALDRDATLENVDYSAWLLTLNTNVLGQHRVTAALMPALARSGPTFKVAFISSHLSSMTDLLEAPLPADLTSTEISYRSSKAALNMVCAAIAVELRVTHPSASVVSIDPGWVDTDMGSNHGKLKPPLKPTTVVAGMRRVIGGLDARSSGRFVRWDGRQVDW